MDDYYLYSGASFFVKKIIEGCSEYSNYIYATLVRLYNKHSKKPFNGDYCLYTNENI